MKPDDHRPPAEPPMLDYQGDKIYCTCKTGREEKNPLLHQAAAGEAPACQFRDFAQRFTQHAMAGEVLPSTGAAALDNAKMEALFLADFPEGGMVFGHISID